MAAKAIRVGADGFIDTIPQVLTPCAHCTKLAVLKRCSRCGFSGYCSHECQKAHWIAIHKLMCTALARGNELNAAVDADAGDSKGPGTASVDGSPNAPEPMKAPAKETIAFARWCTINNYVLQIMMSMQLLHSVDYTLRKIACRVVFDDGGVVHLLEFLDREDMKRLYPDRADRELAILDDVNSNNNNDAKSATTTTKRRIRFAVFGVTRHYTTFAAQELSATCLMMGNGDFRSDPSTLLDAFVTFAEDEAGLTAPKKVQQTLAKFCTTLGCDHANHKPTPVHYHDGGQVLKDAARAKRKATRKTGQGAERRPL